MCIAVVFCYLNREETGIRVRQNDHRLGHTHTHTCAHVHTPMNGRKTKNEAKRRRSHSIHRKTFPQYLLNFYGSPF